MFPHFLDGLVSELSVVFITEEDSNSFTESTTGQAVDKSNNAFYKRPPLDHNTQPVVLIDCEF